MDKFEITAPCMFGIESLLAQEIRDLGQKTSSVSDGRVSFMGDMEDVAAANIFLRTAERVLIKLASFRADTFDSLFEGTKKIPFELFIGKKDIFPVNGHALKSKLFSIPDCQKIIKKAAVSRLSDKYGIRWFEETGNLIPISFLILNDECTIYLDTSGDSLHKRGYRENSGGAPIKETLAAAMVMLARYWGGKPFWDPFCGSGTIAIEAALIGSKTAPGITRSFLCEKWDITPKSAFKDQREKAISQIKPDILDISASDIDESMLNLTKENAKKAGVAKHINVFNADATKITTEKEKGIIVTNPPYGERLLDELSVAKLYTDIGKSFSKLPGWKYYIISSEEDFEKYFGKRADKKRKLYNGMLKCDLYQYFKI